MFFINTNFKNLSVNESLLTSSLENFILRNNWGITSLTINFIDDSALLAINQDILSHDHYTDIICFDYSSNNNLNLDMYLSVERAIENAKSYSESINSELYRLIIHGVLHAFGYLDNSTNSKRIMRSLENKEIDILPSEMMLSLFHVEQFL